MNTTPTCSGMNIERRTLNAENRTFGTRIARHFQLRRSAFKQSAFTLVEMLLVLVILAVLAAIVVPKFAGRGQQARLTAAAMDISLLSTGLNTFELDNGFFPPGNTGLSALVEQPSNLSSWKGPYLLQPYKRVPLDPWGNAYIYSYPGKANPKYFDLSSMGPDGQAGTDDDVANFDAKK